MPIRPGGYNLPFFTDKFLYDTVSKALQSARAGAQRRNIHANVVDPFNALFESALNSIEAEDWFAMEMARQNGKTLSNAIGAMHQELIGGLPGWESTGSTGGIIDLKHDQPWGERQKPVLAEVKNKYNTLNSGGAQGVYRKLQDARAFYKATTGLEYDGYLVTVITKTPEKGTDQPWQVAGLGRMDEIRSVSAKNLYGVTTGDAQAFSRLWSALPEVIEDYLGSPVQDSVGTLQEIFSRAFSDE